ncbi:hypothetical protein BJ912DRAFT_1002281 [Pholiota molesta]|nr:hypothetical protein BJ912DRAFT_1002281 [Pholiota molesta]
MKWMPRPPLPHHGPQYPPIHDPNTERVPSLIRQTAEYARMHLPARPFLLFSIAHLIFESEFYVPIFDRARVKLYLVHDMRADTRIFVRVVRSLTRLESCRMTSRRGV